MDRFSDAVIALALAAIVTLAFLGLISLVRGQALAPPYCITEVKP